MGDPGAAIAAAAMSFAAYLATLMPNSPLAEAPTAVALALLWLLTGIHVLGVEHGGRFQRWIALLKIGAVLVGAGLALAFGEGDWSHLGAPTAGIEPALGSTAVALIFVLYAFSGWNAHATSRARCTSRHELFHARS